jgi:hypothetical protein
MNWPDAEVWGFPCVVIEAMVVGGLPQMEYLPVRLLRPSPTSAVAQPLTSIAPVEVALLLTFKTSKDDTEPPQVSTYIKTWTEQTCFLGDKENLDEATRIDRG